MSIPNTGVQIKTFRRVNRIDGEENFKEVRQQEGERRVNFEWGKGVDGFIPPVEFEEEQQRTKRWRKLSKE